jgi:hypothetical protein
VSPLELRQIQYYMEVAKREHVTEVATQLHVRKRGTTLFADNIVALFTSNHKSPTE